MNPPHLTLRGYEAQDYMEKDVSKSKEYWQDKSAHKKDDYAQTWYVPAWRGHLLDHRQTLNPNCCKHAWFEILVPGDNCAFFEDQSVRCFVAFGAKLGRLYCDLEHRDLQECVMNDKKERRFMKIRDVRFKKWLRGEIPHIYEPLADFLKSVHGAPTAYPSGHRNKK